MRWGPIITAVLPAAHRVPHLSSHADSHDGVQQECLRVIACLLAIALLALWLAGEVNAAPAEWLDGVFQRAADLLHRIPHTLRIL